MPNWASNINIIYSKKEKTVKDLYEKLHEWILEPSKCLEAWKGRSNWLGNILMQAGIDIKDTTNPVKINYRGEMSHTWVPSCSQINNEKYHYLIVYTKTAWIQTARFWPTLLSKLYPDDDTLGFAYFSEEENCGVFEKYDPNNMLQLSDLFTGKETYEVITNIEDYPKLLHAEFPDNREQITTEEAKEILETILDCHLDDNFEEKIDKIQKQVEEKLQEIFGEDAYFHLYPIKEITNLDDKPY